MNLTFQHPVYLWFLLSLIVLVLLHFVTLQHTKRRALKFANFEAIERVTGSEILSKNVLLLYIRLLIIFCVIFAIAGTTIWYSGKSSDSDFVIAIDASASMATQDILPNRLEAAKEAAVAFVNAIKARTQVAVISFSGASFVEQELTSDFLRVKDAIRSIELKYVGGTDILDAVVTSTDTLIRGDNRKTIILITDGQLNVGTVEEVIEYAKKNGVAIHTIGVGSPFGGEMALPGTQASSGLMSKLDEDSLESVAYNTGGTYHRATSKDELNKAYTDILSSGTARLSFNASATLILIALVLLLIEWLLINTRYRTLP